MKNIKCPNCKTDKFKELENKKVKCEKCSYEYELKKIEKLFK
jgi:uncharacterized Zn finger protein (UPF0148 family)